VANRRLRSPLTGSADWEEFPGHSVCRPLLRRSANIDEITFPTKGFTGLTLRLFDVQRREWSLNWAAEATGRLHPPMNGRFEGERGEFHGFEYNGPDLVPCRFIWSDISADSARWEQAFQAPDGSWETNWVMEFSRADD